MSSQIEMRSRQERIQLEPGKTFRLLRWTKNVSSAEVLLGPKQGISLHGQGDHWHYHHAMELTLVQGGIGTRFVADSIESYHSGDLVLIGTNVPHYLYQDGDSSGISIQWEFPSDHGIWSFSEAESLHRIFDLSKRGLRITGSTAEVVRQQMEVLVTLGGFNRVASFLKILAHVAEGPEQDVHPLASAPFSITGAAAHQDAMRDAVSYILAHYRDPISLAELLHLTSMSRPTFTRQFRLHTGKSFSDFHNHVRLQAVCRALHDPSDSISCIALNHGFNQLSFFNRLFRRQIGVNPTEYRARLLREWSPDHRPEGFSS